MTFSVTEIAPHALSMEGHDNVFFLIPVKLIFINVFDGLTIDLDASILIDPQ